MSVGEGRKHWQAVSAALPPPPPQPPRHHSPLTNQEYWLVHRVDLHAALKEKATSPSGLGIPVTLHTAAAVADVDCARATVTLADGSTASADAVLAADGVHSVARNIVTGGAYGTKTSGKCCYRWLMPHAVLEDDAEIRELVGEPGLVTEVAGADRRIVFYPCKDGQLMNCAAFVPVEEVGVIQKGEERERERAAMAGLMMSC